MSEEQDTGVKIEAGTLEEQLDKMNLSAQEEWEQEEKLSNEEVAPKYGTIAWSEWLMNKLTESEYYTKKDPKSKEDRKYPTTDGLRRLCCEYLGEIISSCCHVVQCPTFANGRLTPTVVEHKISVRVEATGHILTTSDVAEVWDGNTDPTFMAFPASSCATKALGRALRKILGLYGVLTIEETGNPNTDLSELGGGRIGNGQINFINLMCKQNDINVMKYINSGKKAYGRIEDITADTAERMIEKLSDYNTKHETIPQKLKGYEPNWRNVNDD